MASTMLHSVSIYSRVETWSSWPWNKKLSLQDAEILTPCYLFLV